MNRDVKHALSMAIVWTLLAILATAVILFREAGPFQILAAIVFTFDAILWWSNYAKKRQEEQNHE